MKRIEAAFTEKQFAVTPTFVIIKNRILLLYDYPCHLCFAWGHWFARFGLGKLREYT